MPVIVAGPCFSRPVCTEVRVILEVKPFRNQPRLSPGILVPALSSDSSMLTLVRRASWALLCGLLITAVPARGADAVDALGDAYIGHDQATGTPGRSEPAAQRSRSGSTPRATIRWSAW
jgi:hypothetical protein